MSWLSPVSASDVPNIALGLGAGVESVLVGGAVLAPTSLGATGGAPAWRCSRFVRGGLVGRLLRLRADGRRLWGWDRGRW